MAGNTPMMVPDETTCHHHIDYQHSTQTICYDRAKDINVTSFLGPQLRAQRKDDDNEVNKVIDTMVSSKLKISSFVQRFKNAEKTSGDSNGTRALCLLRGLLSRSHHMAHL